MEESSTSRRNRPKLSICISTLNRAAFVQATVEAILPQLTDECEVLVADNTSTDNTPRVMAELMRRSDRVQYARFETNKGLDANFDRAVEFARGDYCWLMADDDSVLPGAVAAVLQALEHEPSAVVVNYEFRNFNLSKVLQARAFDFDRDRTYGAWELDRLFVELGEGMRFIGAHVMRREIWLSRDRTLYNGSYYAFVGMMFQSRFPGPVQVVARPCISYRFGNDHSFDDARAEIMFAKWPSLVASLPLLDCSKKKLNSALPWKHFYNMLRWRGSGVYSLTQYRRWIRPQLRGMREKWIPVICALVPRSLATLLLMFYLSARGKSLRELQGLHLAIMKSRNPLRPWATRNRVQHKQTPESAAG